MNKKGFMKVLEAIIAIVIVFTVVLTFLPRAERNTGKIPPDLQLIADTILEDAQKDQDFRKCVLGGVGGQTYPECITKEVEDVLGPGSAWIHAEKICEIEIGTTGKVDASNCYFIKEDATVLKCIDVAECSTMEIQRFLHSMPIDKDIFTKSVSIKYPDVTANPPNPPGDKTKELVMYFWAR